MPDTFKLDTFSIIPRSVKFYKNGEKIRSSKYQLNASKSKIIWKGKNPNDTLTAIYRILPISFTKPYRHKKEPQYVPEEKSSQEPYVFRPGKDENSNNGIFGTGLNKQGSISRGISLGNSQDVTVNSDLNLSFSGKISEKFDVKASITDNNIPIQPEGNTQKLQDFDKVFIKLFSDRSSLIAGDFKIENKKSHFLRYEKRAQGATFSTSFPLGNETEDKELSVQASAALSKGKFARNIIQGREGNQGPYQLKGNNNESFIVIIAGTERVYLDGKLLERGQDKDYIIDYNTAEIVFTPNVTITKDRRIKVEFQYTDQNYTRSLLQSNAEYKSDKLRLKFEAYSEQDAKNQPLQQKLTDKNKSVLSNAGDNNRKMVVPSIDTTEFSNDKVMYKKIDSLGFDSVFVHSNNPDSARYKLDFTNVGEGNGNYIQESFSSNGKVFKWVAPDTSADGKIIRNGSYSPVIVLIAPRKKQMFHLEGEAKINSNTNTYFDVAFSNNDQNTFSAKDRADNTDIGINAGIDRTRSLQKGEDHPWKLSSNLEVEYVGKNFNPIERFRSVEFKRDWNIKNLNISKAQKIGTAGLKLHRKDKGSLKYSFKNYSIGDGFIDGEQFTGRKHNLNSNLNFNKWNFDLNGSMLNTKANEESNFIRHKANISKEIGRFKIGFNDEHELNRFKNNRSDTLLNKSYQFYDWEVYFAKNDSTKNNYRLFYSQRLDKAPKNNDLKRATVANEYGGKLDILSNPDQRLSVRSSIRNLMIEDTALSVQNPENTLLNRIEYRARLFNGAITSNTFYEVGSGMERKKEFIYLEVPAGKGSFVWNDYNDDGVKDLSEFEKAVFQDNAKYIRSFIPTNEFVRTFTNQFNQILKIRPGKFNRDSKNRNFLSRFYNILSYSVDRKTEQEKIKKAYDPFRENISDTSLLSLNSTIRNTIYFNRSDPHFGMDYTYRETSNKSLLSNGFNSRLNRSNILSIRWNLTKNFTLESELEKGMNINQSDFLNGRNYEIENKEFRPKFTYQPNTKFRIALTGRYAEKTNKKEFGGEKAVIRKIGTELKYNSTSKGSISGRFNYIKIDYEGRVNNSLTFEMLESLQKGKNATWNLTFRRKIGKNFQLNLNYTGRTSEDTRTVHTGNAQLRAFF